jgi:pimeloyl-ACP methyl ester carboxylesterase
MSFICANLEQATIYQPPLYRENANKTLFKATWSEGIESLNPQARTLSQKIYDFAKSVVLFIPMSILEPIGRLSILPSSSLLGKFILWKRFQPEPESNRTSVYDFDLQKSLRDKNYTSQELEVTTPDNITLKGHFIKHPDPKARTLILFHGNCDFYQSDSALWLMDLLNTDETTPYNFILFNPRGIGNSEGSNPNENKLLIDAESIYQAATTSLNIPEANIDLYGHSIGGAQAANLKKLHPETGGKLFLDRTFSSLENMITSLFTRPRPYITRLAKALGWEFNTAKTLESIADPVHIFSHENDAIIRDVGKLSPIQSPNITSHVFTHTPVDAHNAPLIKATPFNALPEQDPNTPILPRRSVKNTILNCFAERCPDNFLYLGTTMPRETYLALGPPTPTSDVSISSEPTRSFSTLGLFSRCNSPTHLEASSPITS